MHSFRPEQFEAGVAPVVVWLINDVARAQALLELSEKRRPVMMKTLRQVAFAQSIESSNRIEGITAPRPVLDALILNKRRPRDRPEEDIAGYRDALAWIHEHHADIPITPTTLKDLHRLALSGAGHAGQFKQTRSDIYLFEHGREPELLFATMAPEKVPEAVEKLCRLYEHTLEQSLTLPLLAAASFVLDFLAIHPFFDGNGRVSRLVTLLLLYKQGHLVGRYISLERIIEQHKDGYYNALRRSQANWHEGQHDLAPWWSYFLTALKRAYAELTQSFEALAGQGETKSAFVRRVIEDLPKTFTKADITRHTATISTETIRNVLRKMKSEGLIELQGKGRGARWRKRS